MDNIDLSLSPNRLRGYAVAFYVEDEGSQGWDLVARNKLIGDRIDEFAESRFIDPTRYFARILRYVEPAEEEREDGLSFQIRKLSENERRELENFYISRSNELEIRLLSQEEDAIRFVEEKMDSNKNVFLALSQREIDFLNSTFPDLQIIGVEVMGTRVEDLAELRGHQRKSDFDQWRTHISFRWRYHKADSLLHGEIEAVDSMIKLAQSGRRL